MANITHLVYQSVEFSSLVVSDSLWPHGLQHARLPCPSPTPGACSNSCLSSWWCHPNISSSVIPFSSHLQSFPASGSFQMSQFIRWPKYWSFSFNISPSNEHSGLISFRMDWLDLLVVQGTLKSIIQYHSSKASILQCSAFFIVQHLHMTIGKKIVLTSQTFVGNVMSLLFNMLSRFVTAFLPRSKHLLISWLQSPSAVILEPKKIKSLTVSIVSPSICHEVMGPDAMILVFWMLSFKPAFHSPLSLSLRGSLLFFVFCHMGGVICISEVIDISPRLAFHLMHSAYKLNKQCDNIQPWCTPFPIWNQSIFPCLLLTIASSSAQISQEAGQMIWYSHL